jgi:hypothetical protein
MLGRVFLQGDRVRRWVLVACLLPVAASVRAQSTGGTILGVITDTGGGVLPGVTVTTRNAETGFTRTTVTEADGQYQVLALPPGRYDLTADLQGFQVTEVRDLTLTIGLQVRQDLTLSIGSLQESVTVTGEAPAINVVATEVSAVVTQQQIQTLPVEGRSAITLALLMPGTTTDAQRPQRPGASVGTGGLTAAATNYIVDGLNNMISRAGDAREDLPQSAIQEFKVHVSQMPAEFGGRAGGVVNVVTKAGTNAFSGEVFEYFRHKALNRMDRFQQQRHDEFGEPEPDFRRHQFGGTLGGPIVRDRLHFFVTAERTDIEEFFTVATGKPEFYGAHEGTFAAPSFTNVLFARSDVQISPQMSLYYRFSKQDTLNTCQGCGGTVSSFGNDNKVPGHTNFVGHTWVLSNRILNEFQALRAESFQSSETTEKYTPPGYESSVGSTRYVFPSFRWGSSPGTFFNNYYYQFREALSISLSAHTLKFGGGIQWLPNRTVVPGQPLGTFTFTSDQYFNPSDPAFRFDRLQGVSQFTASFPPNIRRNNSHTYEAYVQDEWRLRPNLTLNLGLRYDRQTKIWSEHFSQSRYPRPLPYVDFPTRGDTNNFQPRLGFAWNLRDGQTVVRGGYGVIHMNMQNSLNDGELDAFKQFSVNIRNPAYPDPYQGRDPATFVSTAPPNITILANDMENAPSYTANGGVSHQLGADLSLHVDGVYTRTVKFPVNVRINSPDPVTGVRPLPEWGIIIQRQSLKDGTFQYRALMARLEKRFSRLHQYMMSYTLAKQDAAWAGTGSNFGTNMTDAAHPEWDQGPFANDRRHNFVLSGAVLLPYDVTLGGVWTLRSSMPFTSLAGVDLNRDGANTDYVPGTTANMGNRETARMLELVNTWRASRGRGPIPADQIDQNSYNRMDIRASKTVMLGGSRKLDLIAQLFNVLGTDNLGGVGTGWVTNALSDTFGRILDAQPRQQAEFAVRFTF